MKKKPYVHKPFSRKESIIVCVLLGAFIGLMLFIAFATHNVYEQMRAVDICKENENVSDSVLWAMLPQCMYKRLQENPGIEIRINVTDVERMRK
jgi:hypothetical protein